LLSNIIGLSERFSLKSEIENADFPGRIKSAYVMATASRVFGTTTACSIT